MAQGLEGVLEGLMCIAGWYAFVGQAGNSTSGTAVIKIRNITLLSLS
jgi:hypothetical protein